MAAVTTVIVPADRPAGSKGPILSYQCAIDAVAGRCFPSYALRRGAKAAGALAQFEFLLVSAALAEGWAVSIPDHEGPRRDLGRALRTGLPRPRRSARGAEPRALNLSAEAPIGLWGYSGGGLATAWATEVYADYAPELNLVGAVLGSPVGDLGHTFRRLNGSFFSGLPALVVAALSHVYPDLDRVINEHVTAEGKAMLTDIQRMTTAHAVIKLIRKDMGDHGRRTAGEHPARRPRCSTSSTASSSAPRRRACRCSSCRPCTTSIVSVADIDELTDTYAPAAPTSPTTATCSASTCCCIRCRRR